MFATVLAVASNIWAPSGNAVAKAANVSFTISVKQQNLEVLKTTALAVSTPGTAQYGKFMTKAAIDALTAPRIEDVQAVTSWLLTNGISHTVQNELILASTTVSATETLFGTQFFEVQNRDHGKRIMLGAYELPSAVRSSIASIFGLRGLPLPKRVDVVTGPSKAGRDPGPDNVRVTPAVIASTYSVRGVSVERGNGNTQAVAEFEGQRMSKSDLAAFFKKDVPGALAGDDEVSKFVGEPYQEDFGGEALLDIELIMGVTPGVATQFWGFFKYGDFCNDLLNFTDTLLASNVSVMSISYGYQGNASDICDDQTVQTIDVNFAKLAAKGVSVLISSGDAGSGYTPIQTCDQPQAVTIKGEVVFSLGPKDLPANTTASDCCQLSQSPIFSSSGWTFSGNTTHLNCTLYDFITGTTPAPKGSTYQSGGVGICPYRKCDGVIFPAWPASSPWVTAVGSTRFMNHTVGNHEMASDAFGSGGGFSSQFSQADAPWQVAAVAAYVAKGHSLPNFPDDAHFSAKGRATPDVATLGEGYEIVVEGYVKEGQGGTSASAPTFAALISLINDARMQAGKPRMGFLNPFLYKNPDAFTDIVNGTNAIQTNDRGDAYPTPIGFAAAPGWDAATGLGTPVFSKLLAKAMA